MVDIEIYLHHGDGYWAQAKFLVHGIDDVLWTNDIDAALDYLRADIETMRENDESK